MFTKLRLSTYIIGLFSVLAFGITPLYCQNAQELPTQLVLEQQSFIQDIESKPLLFSNHERQQVTPLNGSVYELMNKAEHSILIITFTLTDSTVIELINQKALQGINVTLIIDRDHLDKLRTLLDPSVHIGTRLTGEGHVHHKILVVDEAYIWIGSSNFTFGGDKNVAVGFYDHAAGIYLHQEASFIESQLPRANATPISIITGNQHLDLYVLPHHQPGTVQPIEQEMNALANRKMINLIDNSKKDIKVSIAMCTYKDISRALIRAHQRGVKVAVSTGSLREEAIGLLINAGIPVKLTSGAHYKWMLIDDQILLNGSPNWSMNMFSRSDESFVVLYDLLPEQLSIMMDIWKLI